MNSLLVLYDVNVKASEILINEKSRGTNEKRICPAFRLNHGTWHIQELNSLLMLLKFRALLARDCGAVNQVNGRLCNPPSIIYNYPRKMFYIFRIHLVITAQSGKEKLQKFEILAIIARYQGAKPFPPAELDLQQYVFSVLQSVVLAFSQLGILGSVLSHNCQKF